MSSHILCSHGQHAVPMQAEVLGWFTAGHNVLWIPIVEVGSGPQAIAQAQAHAEALGLPYLLDSIDEFARLPEGVKGWVFPAHQEDTCIVATRNGAEVTFGVLRHPVTGEAISYRTDTESAVGFTPPWAKQPQSAV